MTEFVKEQFRRLTLKANAPADEFAIRQWREMAERVVSDIGEQKFATAVQRYMDSGERFFPASPIELRNFAPVDPGKRCYRCEKTDGFVIEKRPSPIYEGRTSDVAVRCTHGCAA